MAHPAQQSRAPALRPFINPDIGPEAAEEQWRQGPARAPLPPRTPVPGGASRRPCLGSGAEASGRGRGGGEAGGFRYSRSLGSATIPPAPGTTLAAPTSRRGFPDRPDFTRPVVRGLIGADGGASWVPVRAARVDSAEYFGGRRVPSGRRRRRRPLTPQAPGEFQSRDVYRPLFPPRGTAGKCGGWEGRRGRPWTGARRARPPTSEERPGPTGGTGWKGGGGRGARGPQPPSPPLSIGRRGPLLRPARFSDPLGPGPLPSQKNRHFA